MVFQKNLNVVEVGRNVSSAVVVVYRILALQGLFTVQWIHPGFRATWKSKSATLTANFVEMHLGAPPRMHADVNKHWHVRSRACSIYFLAKRVLKTPFFLTFVTLEHMSTPKKEKGEKKWPHLKCRQQKIELFKSRHFRWKIGSAFKLKLLFGWF